MISKHQSYFNPLPDPELEALAAFLYQEWQKHEAIIAEWSQRIIRPWSDLEPDIQRSYRAMAIAARELQLGLEVAGALKC